MSEPIRIWVQGATDQVGHRAYLASLLPHLQACVEPGVEIEFHTTSPSLTTTHALSEFRFARAVIRSAIEAEKAGYDAYLINHFQDAGMAEARAVVDIPVIGLGEATLLYACTLGRRLGLLAISPNFIPWHEDQVQRHGLQQRVVGVRTLDAGMSDYMDAFEKPDTRARLQAAFDHEARALLDAGADVIVPTGGIPMMLFAKEHGARIDGAPIVNGVTVGVKTAEMAIKLRRMAGLAPSRRPRSGYAKPLPQTLDEFLNHG